MTRKNDITVYRLIVLCLIVLRLPSIILNDALPRLPLVAALSPAVAGAGQSLTKILLLKDNNKKQLV